MEAPPTPSKKPRQKPGPKGPSKFNEARARQFIKLVSRNISKMHAAALVGVDRESIRLWAARGEADHHAGLTNAYTRFFGDLRRALAKALSPHEEAVQAFQRFRPWRKKKGGRARAVTKTDERRAAIMREQAKLGLAVLRVRDPKRWGEPVRKLEHSGPGGTPLLPTPREEGPAVDFSRLSQADYQRYQELAEVARSGFDTMAPEQTAELQALLRKARGQ